VRIRLEASSWSTPAPQWASKMGKPRAALGLFDSPNARQRCCGRHPRRQSQVWVVETGMPRCVTKKSVIAPPASRCPRQDQLNISIDAISQAFGRERAVRRKGAKARMATACT
jgi:hypothetical protein